MKYCHFKWNFSICVGGARKANADGLNFYPAIDDGQEPTLTTGHGLLFSNIEM